MPSYYQIQRTATTNATPGTENLTDLLFLTGTGVACGISVIAVNARSPSGTSLAGVAINWQRYSTAGSGGSAGGIRKANPNNASATTAVTTGASVGTTRATQRSVGCAAPGGAGGWMAIERDDQMVLLGGGGANGNMETSTLAGIASIVVDYTTDFNEF